jgi:hypothetical protein
MISPEVAAVLARTRVRYLLFGTFALQVHGFNFGEPDVDIWLDPSLGQDRWRDVVRKIAGEHELIFRDHVEAVPPCQSARIHCRPHMDIISRPSGHADADFEPLYWLSTWSRYGKLPPVKVLLRSKLHASRPKDYRHVMRCSRQLLNIW